MDDAIDRLHRRIVGIAKGIIREGPDSIEAGLHIFSAAGHLERIAGHAAGIAEEVAYLAAGPIIRHRREDGSETHRRACPAPELAARRFPT
jgi:phosphate transport system protein